MPGLEIGPDRDSGATVTASVPPDRYFEVSPATARLLRAIDGQRSIEELARDLSDREPRISADELGDVIERTLVARGLVHFGSPRAPAAAPRSRMWLRVPLLRADVANRLAGPLEWMCRGRAPLALIALAAAVHGWFYGVHADFGGAIRLSVPASWLVPLLVLAIALLIHELGHAAALRARGETAGEIGFGVYWIWPVLFSDVQRAWRLAPRERVMVDAGGLLMQAVAASLMMLVWAVAPSPGLARGIALVDLGIVANLNPLFRWDGYWLLSDLTAVTDLRRRAFASVLARLGGRPAGEPAWMTAYVVLSVLGVVVTVLALARGVLPRLIG